MKKYENPMLQVVSIRKTNVIVTSGGIDGGTLGNSYRSEDKSYSADRMGRESWDAGY